MGLVSQHKDVVRTAAVAVAVALSCLGVAIWLNHLRQSRPAHRAQAVAEPKAVVQGRGAPWPVFGGDPQHLGRAVGALAEKLDLAWTFKTSGSVKASPVIEDGRVFVGSADANLYALDLRTGQSIWSYKTGDAVEASACVKDGVVCVGSTDGWLYAVDAHTGDLKWKYQTGGQIAGGANWVPNPRGDGAWIVAGSYDGCVHCVDGQTGQRIWMYKTDNYVNGSPAVAGSLCVIGGCDARVHVVSVADGNGVSTIETGSYIAASAAIWEGQVYVGNYNGDFVKVDLATRQVVWRYGLENTAIVSSAAIGDQTVVFGARDRQVHCLRQQDGRPVWTFKALGEVDGSPALCDGKVVVGSEDGRLTMLRLSDGGLLWSYLVGKALTSSPAIAYGVVVIGCDDGSVYAFAHKE